MKKKKYLPLYEKWVKAGKIPENGLCDIFENDSLFSLIDPERGVPETYWGYDDIQEEHHQLKIPIMELWYGFTPLRQNIVLLMAALNGEL